jgi:predicted Zn finger-like uncharacterized protein
MTIPTRCPSCGAQYQLSEEQAGRRVRCRKCDTIITVPDPADEDRGPSRSEGFERDERATDRETAPQKKSSSAWPVLLIVGVVGLVVLLPIAACGGIGYLIYVTVHKTVKEVEETIKPHDPKNVDEAIDYVESNNPFKVQAGCKWIAKENIAEADKAKVSNALDPLLTNGNVSTRVEAARALKKYATKDNVPSLIAALDTPDDFNANEAAETRRLAIEMLASFKDERAIRPIASRMTNSKDRAHASWALINMGMAAQVAAEVKSMKDHPDPAVREEVRRVLEAIGQK